MTSEPCFMMCRLVYLDYLPVILSGSVLQAATFIPLISLIAKVSFIQLSNLNQTVSLPFMSLGILAKTATKFEDSHFLARFISLVFSNHSTLSDSNLPVSGFEWLKALFIPIRS